jgi:ketosteroid isomerase-like protein
MAKDNVDVVQGAWDAFARGDIDGAVEPIAPNAETRVPESVPWGGTYVGPDGFRDFLYKLDQAFDQFKATPDKVLGADDNHVVVVARTRGRTKSGGVVEGSNVWVYQLRDGMIADAEAWADTARVIEALG